MWALDPHHLVNACKFQPCFSKKIDMAVDVRTRQSRKPTNQNVPDLARTPFGPQVGDISQSWRHIDTGWGARGKRRPVPSWPCHEEITGKPGFVCIPQLLSIKNEFPYLLNRGRFVLVPCSLWKVGYGYSVPFVYRVSSSFASHTSILVTHSSMGISGS